MQIEIAQLKHELFEKKEAVCELECTTIQLTDRIKELENELGDMRESIKCKSESLQDTLKALEVSYGFNKLNHPLTGFQRAML